MTGTLAAAPSLPELGEHLALVACGERPGKTRACDSCRRKGQTLLRITSTGAADALAATICGTGYRRAKTCDPCRQKAVRMVRIYNGEGRVRASVFVAPIGTPPTAADVWTHVGYAEEEPAHEHP